MQHRVGSFLTRSAHAAGVAAPQILTLQKRLATRVYTSYFKGDLFPNQLTRPQRKAPQFSAVLKSGYARPKQAASSETPKEADGDLPSWQNADSLDVMHHGGTATLERKNSATSQAQERPYVPLQYAAEVELKGDYCTESGMFHDALQHYGVAATLYHLAYPEHHNIRSGILIKLGVAFRGTRQFESSRANLEAALFSLDRCPQPSLELLCECLMELGRTAEAQGDPDAGKMYEDVHHALEAFHSLGESHRMLRLLPRLGRRFVLNVEQKFVYFSPFDYDRTFAICDQALSFAEEFYRRVANSEGTIRVLTIRKQLLDRKFFNMRDLAGRIRTMRGHWMRRAQHLTNAPTPEELLLYSPTIHQVHRDFRYENTAPLDRQDEVMPGTNRVVVDDGNPDRRQTVPTAADIREHRSVKRAGAARRWEG